MSILLALDSLATPLVGARLSWRAALSGAQFGTLFGKLLFKVFVFTLVLCGYIWSAYTWAPAHLNWLLFPVLPLIVLVGVPLCYAYIKLMALRLHGFGISGFWLLLVYPLAELLRAAGMVMLDVLVKNHNLVISVSAYSLQRSLFFLALLLMALPTPKKTHLAGVSPNPQYFYIAYFLIVIAMLGAFNPGPLQFGINVNLSIAH